MKKTKVFFGGLFFALMAITTFVSAGSYNNFNWDVPPLGLWGEVYARCTETTEVALSVDLFSNGNEVDRVDFTTINAISESQTAGILTLNEGTSGSINNYSTHYANDQIYIEFKNSTGAMTVGYSIRGNCNYH